MFILELHQYLLILFCGVFVSTLIMIKYELNSIKLQVRLLILKGGKKISKMYEQTFPHIKW